MTGSIEVQIYCVGCGFWFFSSIMPDKIVSHQDIRCPNCRILLVRVDKE